MYPASVVTGVEKNQSFDPFADLDRECHSPMSSSTTPFVFDLGMSGGYLTERARWKPRST
jgi:hypothetical protein